MIIGIGTDIIEVSRLAKAVERWGDHFLKHVFTKEEIVYCQSYKFPFERFAGRFAAKEAVIKALPDISHLQWTDIKILNHSDGKPYCTVDKKKLKSASAIHISISHTRNYATAFAVITA